MPLQYNGVFTTLGIDSGFLSRVLPYVTGCTDPIAERAIVDAAIDFCRLTHCIEEQKTVTVPAGGPVPAMTFTTGMMPFFIQSAYWDNREIKLAREDELDFAEPGWRDADDGQPKYLRSALVVDPSASINLVPMTSKEGSLTVRFSMVPTRDTGELPTVLSDVYPDGIVFGAISKILRIPNQPFSNLNLSAAYEEMFKREVSKTRLDAMEQATRGGSKVKMFAFGSR